MNTTRRSFVASVTASLRFVHTPRAAALLAATVLPMAGTAPSVAATVTTLRVATQVEPNTWDPSAAQEGGPIVYYQAVYDTLILRKPNGELVPMLAREWSYDPTRTELTLRLQDGVKFGDGTPFDAAAAKANLDHFKKANGPQAPTVASVMSVEVADPMTVKLKLDEPDPNLLIALSNAAGLMGNPKNLGSPAIKTAPDGTGPYLLDRANTTTGSQYSFTKRPDYWNKDLQKFNTVVIKVLVDQTARMNALLSGQIDATYVNAKIAPRVEAAGMKLHPSQINWTGFVLMDRNGKLVPAMADKRVRQAFNYAIDRNALVKSMLGGRGSSTTQIFGPKTTAFDPALDNFYTYDPEKAKALLAEAGFANGFALEVPVTAGSQDPALLAAIKAQLEAVGIRATIAERPASTSLTDMRTGRYPAAMLNLFQPSTWATLQQVLVPQASWNPFKVEDAQIAGFAKQIRLDPDNTKLAQDLNRHVLSEAWFLPLWRADIQYFTGPNVTVEPQIEQVTPSIYFYSPLK